MNGGPAHRDTVVGCLALYILARHSLIHTSVSAKDANVLMDLACSRLALAVLATQDIEESNVEPEIRLALRRAAQLVVDAEVARED